jgi:hypothetical protein
MQADAAGDGAAEGGRGLSSGAGAVDGALAPAKLNSSRWWGRTCGFGGEFVTEYYLGSSGG